MRLTIKKKSNYLEEGGGTSAEVRGKSVEGGEGARGVTSVEGGEGARGVTSVEGGRTLVEDGSTLVEGGSISDATVPALEEHQMPHVLAVHHHTL